MGRLALPVGVFFAALIVRLLHVWQIRAAPFFTVLMGDSRGYDAWGQRIAAGEWIGSDVFYQAPLYPYFLGTIYTVAGHDLLVVRLVQAVIGAASCALLSLTAMRLFDRRAGLIAGLGFALYAPAIFFDGILQKTVLDVFFVCLSQWLMSRILRHQSTHPHPPPLAGKQSKLRRDKPPDVVAPWVFLGLAMGGLALTRENAMVFVAVILLWITLDPRTRRVRLRAAAGFLLGIAIVLVPVAIRNSIVGGGFYVTTAQFGPNFYLGNNASADGTAQSLRVGRGSAEYERQDATELAEYALGRRLTPAEVSEYWTNRALGFISSQPADWLELMARKFALLWNKTEMLDTESQESYAQWSSVIRIGAIVGHFGVLVPLALIGVWTTWPERKRLWVLYAMVAAYAASVLLFFIYARYRFPLVPFLMLFAAAGLSRLREIGEQMRASLTPAPALVSPKLAAKTRASEGGATSEKKLAGKAAVAAAVLATVVFCNWPVLSADLMRAITEHNLGAALQTDGRVDEAIEHYRRALEYKPDHAPALNNLGAALASKGDVTQAIDHYERAIAIVPDYASAHYNLANALLRTGKPEKAAEHLRTALRSAPGSAEVHNNLGIALMDTRDFDAAAVEFRKALEFEPHSAKSHRNLGNALASSGQGREAIQELRQAVALDPRDGPAHYDLATLLMEAEQPAEAAAEFRLALELMPESVDVLNNLGIALGSLGKIDEAIEMFGRALALQPGFAPAKANLAAALKAR
jgi:Tfp pilus assembly protein PilF/4-amino-4-deoxy-L-arabinose transferase-like glycosyltransferase